MLSSRKYPGPDPFEKGRNMNLANLLALIKAFETKATGVLQGTQKFVDALGPDLATMFPNLAGIEKEVVAAVDFASNEGQKLIPYLDSVVALLQSIVPGNLPSPPPVTPPTGK